MKKNNWTLVELVIVLISFLVIMLVILSIVALLIGGSCAIKSINKQGLKGTVEQVWEGPEGPEGPEPNEPNEPNETPETFELPNPLILFPVIE